MSMPMEVTITCPACQATIKSTAWRSINTDYPNAAELIISGKLFEAKCPKCGFVAHLAYDLLFNDMQHGFYIWVVHHDEKYDAKIENILSQKNILGFYTRIVDGVDALREKVQILQAGKDDRVVELCKQFLLLEAKKLRHEFEPVYMEFVSDNGTCEVLFYEANSQTTRIELTADFYGEISSRYRDDILDADTHNTPFIDAAWARKVIGNL